MKNKNIQFAKTAIKDGDGKILSTRKVKMTKVAFSARGTKTNYIYRELISIGTIEILLDHEMNITFI